ncbi:hypothetical protein [Actinomadura nitritigenes]|uniref:hypothetical protein n=1 Tax=Actinomadura nitritigenes TaxID=134602 RepID=UPI003D8EC8FB
MNRPHAVRTPAPCSRPRRKPACTALTTLLATAAALVATAQAVPAGAAAPRAATSPSGRSPVAAPPPPDRPPDGAAPALSPAAALSPVTMASAEVTALASRPPLAPGRPTVPHSSGGAQTRPRHPSPAPPPAARPANGAPAGPLPGTLAGLAPSAAATGVGGVLSPADSPASPPPRAAPRPGLAPSAADDEAPQAETVPDEAVGAVTNVLKAALPDLPKSVRLHQEDAAAFLRASGIRWRSTGGCSDRGRTSCTSFDGLRWGTLKGLLDFRALSGCPITVTGGTERGHAGGPRSHGTGYKLDIAPSRCVDAAITRYPYQGVRGDGARLYRSPDGTLFARERDHWDITFG